MSITLANLKANLRANLRANESELSPSDLLSFINQAIDMASQEKLFVPQADESLIVAVDTFEYPLTGGTYLSTFKYIKEIWQEEETADNYETYIPKAYYTIEPGSTPYIRFIEDVFPSIAVENRNLRVVGYVTQGKVLDGDDTQILYLPAAYLTWKATAFGHAALSAQGNRRGQWHAGQIGFSEQQAEIARVGATDLRLPAGLKKVPGR